MRGSYMQIGEGAGALLLPIARLLLPRPDPTACLPAALDRTNAAGMAWWIWALAATGGWFGISVAIGGLWAALHRSPHADMLQGQTRRG
jgi:hypothetical protein